MANQVQFIQLSQEEYDNISSKKNGSIYFTTDTHRIYKGGDLYASTTFDTLKFEDLSATSIKVDGVDVSLKGHTHSKTDVIDFPTKVSDFQNDAGYITINDVDLSEYSKIGHTHNVEELNGWKDVELEVGSIEAQKIKINNNDVLTEDKVVPDTNNAGFALNATKAEQDSNGEVISQTYARKDKLTDYITPIVDAAIGNVLTQEEF